jgi:hypothetical protein
VNFKIDCKPKKLLQEILEFGFCVAFPSITVVMCVSVSLPLSVASGERTFILLQQVKNYYRSAKDKIV